MAGNNSKIAPRLPWPKWRWALTGLSALALVLSAYLSWHYLAGSAMIGCGSGGGEVGGASCDSILNTHWSTIRGVLPVSGLAAGAYLAMLIASFFVGPATPAADRRLAWNALLTLAAAAAGSALWFTFIQKWILGTFCPYCMATHITSLLLAALVLWQAPRQSELSGEPAPVSPRRILGPLSAIGLPLLGLALAGALATTQWMTTPPPIYRAGNDPTPQSPLDPRSIPLLGPPDARYLVTLFFDYNCPHCQQVHALLDEAVRRYNGQLAFALCPAPLNSRCNPYIPRDLEEFKNSCELAQIALTVWTARHNAFPDFDRWMFSPDSPADRWHARTLDAATAKAIALVGQTQFDAARADPAIERMMHTAIQRFGQTLQGGNAVPKLAFGSRWVTPEPRNLNDLLAILQNTLSLPPPLPPLTP